jgi:hypothetical protein
MQPNKEQVRRVNALLNAIGDLRRGDLLKVLNLNNKIQSMPMSGADREFSLDKDVKLVVKVPKTMRDRACTGKELAHIVEDNLIEILMFGEVSLPTVMKDRKPGSTELGGRAFVDDVDE